MGDCANTCAVLRVAGTLHPLNLAPEIKCRHQQCYDDENVDRDSAFLWYSMPELAFFEFFFLQDCPKHVDDIKQVQRKTEGDQDKLPCSLFASVGSSEQQEQQQWGEAESHLEHMRTPILFSAQFVLYETEDHCVCDDQAHSVDKPDDPELASYVAFTIPHQQSDGNRNT